LIIAFVRREGAGDDEGESLEAADVGDCKADNNSTDKQSPREVERERNGCEPEKPYNPSRNEYRHALGQITSSQGDSFSESPRQAHYAADLRVMLFDFVYLRAG